MKTSLLLTAAKWVAAAAALAGLLALALFLRGQLNAGRDGGAEDALSNPRRVQLNVVKLGAQLAESYGIKDSPAEPAAWEQRVTVYGRVVPNARATTEVRAPFAGTLRPGPERSWPALGSRVTAGQVLAWLDVRVGPEVRFDLATKLKEARAKLAGAGRVVKLEVGRMERFKSAGGSIAQADLDAARRRLAEAETQLAAAKATVRQWEDALAEIDKQGERPDATWGQPLKAPGPGEITELTGGPGMAVEPGGLVARVVDFRRALVRLDIPLAALAGGPPETVELSVDPALAPAPGVGLGAPAERPAAPVPASLTGTAPQVETTSQSAGFWYEVDTAAPSRSEQGNGISVWRPGLFVTARLKAQGAKPRPAVAVPETALLYHQGRALVYVRIGPGRYERREVQVLGREHGRWLLAAGVTAGEPVVSRRAQVLLSEEFRGEADND